MRNHGFKNVLASRVTPPHWLPHNTYMLNRFTPYLINENVVYLRHTCTHLKHEMTHTSKKWKK